MDQIAPRIADERIADEIISKRITFINCKACRAREVAGGTSATFDRARDESGDTPLGANNSPGFIRTGAVHFSRRTIDGNIDRGRRHRVSHVGCEIAILVHDLANMAAVTGDKFASGSVETKSVLAAPIFRAHQECLWIKRKVRVAQIHFGIIGMPGTTNDPSVSAGSAMNSIIKRPVKRIE